MTAAPDLADLRARIPAPLRVRVGTPDDLERVIDFFNRFARPAEVERIELTPMRDVFFAPDLFDRDGSLLALRDGRIVAMTITAPRTPGIAYTNFTGTARPERGKGLALALKLRAIAELKRKGTRLFGTTNDEANAAMRGINSRLGYVADPPMIEVEKELA